MLLQTEFGPAALSPIILNKKNVHWVRNVVVFPYIVTVNEVSGTNNFKNCVRNYVPHEYTLDEHNILFYWRSHVSKPVI